ncbi:MAG: META domain-containing protein, partial [Solirubrobacteraceae bacterium]
MRSATPVLLLAAAALALVGCGDAAHTPTSAELRGTQFMATSAKGHAFVEGTPPMLDFRDGTVSATGGCNETRGSYAIRGGRLSLGKDAMQTMMGCGTPLEHQDDWLDDVLDARPSVTVGDHGNTLVLATRDQRITFGRQGPSGGPMPIEGPHWTATSLHQTGAFVAIEGPMAHPTLRIKGGHASFFTGCNAGTTTAKVTDRTV